MLLTIDVGNTNLTLGLYEGTQLGAHWRLATDHNRMPDEYGLQFLGLLQNAGKTLDDIHGVEMAVELIQQIKSWTDGVYFKPQFHRYDMVADIIEKIR